MKALKQITAAAMVALVAWGPLVADTTTSRWGLTKPDVGSTNWGPKLNTNSDTIDDAAGQGKTNTFTGSNTFNGTTSFGSGGSSSVTISTNPTVSGKAYLNGGASVTSGTALAISTNATVSGTLGVTGATTLSSTLSQSGGTAAVSSTTVSGSLTVNGASTLTGALTQSAGAASLSSTTVTGTSTLTGAMTQSAGAASLSSTTVNGTLSVTKTSTFSGPVSISSGTSDGVTYNPLTLNGGGANDYAAFRIQSTTGITSSATTFITIAENSVLVLIYYSDGSGNTGTEILLCSAGTTPSVVSTKVVSGSPAARTYSASSGAMKVLFASGTYAVSAFSVGIPNR